MAGIEDVGAGAGGARAAGIDVTHHRYAGGENGLVDVAHGGLQPARRVDAQDDEMGQFAGRQVEGALHVIAGGRADAALDIEPDTGIARGHGLLCRQPQRPEQQYQ